MDKIRDGELPGATELARLEDFARRTLAVDDGTNPRLQGESALAERIFAMKFRNESPRIILELIAKLRATQHALVILTENLSRRPKE